MTALGLSLLWTIRHLGPPQTGLWSLVALVLGTLEPLVRTVYSASRLLLCGAGAKTPVADPCFSAYQAYQDVVNFGTVLLGGMALVVWYGVYRHVLQHLGADEPPVRTIPAGSS